MLFRNIKLLLINPKILVQQLYKLYCIFIEIFDAKDMYLSRYYRNSMNHFKQIPVNIFHLLFFLLNL